MILFQWVAIPILILVVLLDGRKLFQRRGAVTTRVTRASVCLLAAILIAFPRLTVTTSEWFGIGRGTDFIIYLFVLAAPTVWFRLTMQIHRLQRQVIELSRVEALRTAEFPIDPAATDS